MGLQNRYIDKLPKNQEFPPGPGLGHYSWFTINRITG